MSYQITSANGTVLELDDLDNLTPKIKKSFDFLSDGIDVGQDKSGPVKNIKNPISIKSPLSISDRFGAFDMYESAVEAVNAQVKNILLTNKGERLGNFDFGADIQRILFESSISSIEDILARSINQNVKKYCPGVKLQNMAIYTSEQLKNLQENEILLRVSFNIESLGAFSKLDLIFQG